MVQHPNLEIKAKVEELFRDKDTKGWHDSLNSETLITNYPKHVAEYLIHRKISIRQMISNFKNDQVKESKRLQEFVNLQLKRLAPASVSTYVSAIKNRLEYDGISLVKKIRIPNRHKHPTIENQSVPTKDQILSFLSHANVRVQIIIALISFLGVRFILIAGLKIGDFPEMKIEDVDGYCHVTELDELKENEFNLNVPRYVDISEPEEEIDIQSAVNELKNLEKERKAIEDKVRSDLKELRIKV